jgi:hypothetical protein
LDNPDQELVYFQPARMAVFCAHRQFAFKDFNTWEYERLIEVPGAVRRTKHGWLAGNFWAKAEV